MTSSMGKFAAATCVVVVASLAVSGSRVRAQTSGTSKTSGTTAVTGSSTATSTSGVPATARANNPAPLSAADQAAAAETIVGRGTVLSQRVGQMLDDARREADMIRVTCLNDKLTQINANLRTAQSRQGALQKAVDVDQRNHELTVLTVLGQKLQLLDQESNQCVGQDLYETGATKVVTEIDTSVLPFENDPTNPQIQTPTAPSVLGVMDASSNGASSP